MSAKINNTGKDLRKILFSKHPIVVIATAYNTRQPSSYTFMYEFKTEKILKGEIGESFTLQLFMQGQSIEKRFPLSIGHSVILFLDDEHTQDNAHIPEHIIYSTLKEALSQSKILFDK